MMNPVGRPEIGPAFSVRFTPELLERVDTAAKAQGFSRAEWLRRATEDRLVIPREELSGFVQWVLDEGGVDNTEVARIIEKPDAYLDWFEIYKAGGTMTDVDQLETTPQ